MTKPQASSKQPRILLYDIETSYLMARIWAPGHKISVGHKQLVPGFDVTRIICIAYKWVGESKVHTLDWGIKVQNQKPMLEKFSRVLAEADLAIGHNLDNFDLKHINTALLLADLPPLPLHSTEDTLKQVRKHFRFPSNTLDYISHLLTNSPKTKLPFVDWVRVVEEKDPKALKRMLSYCAQDVIALEKVWQRIRKYCKPKANASLIQHNHKLGCPRCGSENRHGAGLVTLAAGRYRRYSCQDCGHKWRSSTRLS